MQYEKKNKVVTTNDTRGKKVRGRYKKNKLEDMESHSTNKWDKMVDKWIEDNS